MPAFVEVGCENVCVFVDGAILNDGFFAFTNLSDLVEATVQKIDLQMVCPPGHVLIKIAQIGIVIHRFIKGNPIVMFGQFFCQCSFAGSDVAGNGNVFQCSHELFNNEVAKVAIFI
jgi:hypothetical protein